MDDCEKEAKPTPRYTSEQKFLIVICCLGFVGSCLITFLFVRIESFERRTRTEEAKLRENINYLKIIITRPALAQTHRVAMSSEQDGGKPEENGKRRKRSFSGIKGRVRFTGEKRTKGEALDEILSRFR